MQTLFNANGEDYRAWEKHRPRVKLLGMDIRADGIIHVATGDMYGMLHLHDSRVGGARVNAFRAHWDTMMQSGNCSPMEGNLVLTAGNDNNVRLFDLRVARDTACGDCVYKYLRYAPCSSLPTLSHPGRVLYAAYFSPVTGRKVLTTCEDNCLRVWDYVAGMKPRNAEPDCCILRSGYFSRSTMQFGAVWDPEDLTERAILCGNYISEDLQGADIYPVDWLDASREKLLDATKGSSFTAKPTRTSRTPGETS
ncbi:hypothetical protein H632_c67p1 [Helicosporidium sp. ATCC 50920]|nr:hypothetical protein H632_c67p1 [Helicosporidium sp. ATCC 50920]|eukprot:KDD76918.1 hypothetical protein H632_c67p1 [Helicosporidium sp. ATCC 50920]